MVQARILVTQASSFRWGMALVRTPWQFYVARILLGLAEAGFFPGVIVYFSHWFPRAQRGRALAGMILGVPVSQALGRVCFGETTGNADWFGLAGWQVDLHRGGRLAVPLGIAVPFFVLDRSALTGPLVARSGANLAGGDAGNRPAGSGRRRRRQRSRRVPALNPTVWLLAMGIFAANLGGYALAFWLPTAIKNLLKATQGSATDEQTTKWACLIYLCGVVGVWVSGQLSDRTGQRKWLCVLGQVVCRGVSGDQRNLRGSRELGLRLGSVPDGSVLFRILVFAVLDLADTAAVGLGRGGRCWVHQYGRQSRGLYRSLGHWLDEKSGIRRAHMPHAPGSVLCGWGSDYCLAPSKNSNQ